MDILIDQTVILRYILEDDETYSNQATAVIAEGSAFTYPEMFARVAITLRDVYKVPRSQIGYTLVMLLEDISVVEEHVVKYASELFGRTSLDYIDCLMVARNVLNGNQMLTFDDVLNKRYY